VALGISAVFRAFCCINEDIATQQCAPPDGAKKRVPPVSANVRSLIRSVVQYNPTLLNRFLAPGIAEFSSADIPDLRVSHPEAEHWMSNHFLNNIYRDAFIGKTRQFVVNLLCRAQAQFTQYDHARDTTLEYLSRSSVHSPVPRLYFAAIVQWETCFLSYQMFVDVLVKMGGRKRMFQPNDGSEEQRAYDVANAIKHWAGVISGNQHHDDDTIPLWLTNDGFQTKALSLTYSELGAITNEVAKTANELQDVRAFKAT
jgi:hypothetical protein